MKPFGTCETFNCSLCFTGYFKTRTALFLLIVYIMHLIIVCIMHFILMYIETRPFLPLAFAFFNCGYRVFRTLSISSGDCSDTPIFVPSSFFASILTNSLSWCQLNFAMIGLDFLFPSQIFPIL